MRASNYDYIVDNSPIFVTTYQRTKLNFQIDVIANEKNCDCTESFLPFTFLLTVPVVSTNYSKVAIECHSCTGPVCKEPFNPLQVDDRNGSSPGEWCKKHTIKSDGKSNITRSSPFAVVILTFAASHHIQLQ
ncbi:unnamed protein product [Adineta ricciae]|uniref:Uncharacterized protein n=1 Tax=Adineta ricciae TaxID=249248 RepID=A0A813SAK8_ADIRI|nr:unnamed protein product [Adineta ricciae]